MRARWAFWIAGGALVLAVALLLFSARPIPEPLTVSVLYRTNISGTTLYTFQISNTAAQPYVFTVWMECWTNGVWRRAQPYHHGQLLQPSGKDVFAMPYLEHGNPRLTVLYGRDSSGRWLHRLNSLRALLGLHPKGERMYILLE